jgi:phosphomannomutase
VVGTLFGTDGVRGLANRDLTADLALDLLGVASPAVRIAVKVVSTASACGAPTASVRR